MRVQLVEYDPWGKVSREEGTSEASRRFTGKMLDPESGLYYYGGRYYDPELGRFISPDPFVPQPGDPQSFNRYSYVENNPVNKIDPSGYKSFWKKIGKAFKKFFSSTIGKIVTAAVFAVATVGAVGFTAGLLKGGLSAGWSAAGAAIASKTALVAGLAAGSAAGVMEIPPVKRFIARAGIGAAIGIGLGLNMGFQLGYAGMVTEPGTVVEREALSSAEEVQLKEVVEDGSSYSYLKNPSVDKPVNLQNATSVVRDSSGAVRAAVATSDVGSLVGAHTDVAGLIGRGFTLPSRPWYGYGIFGISHQAANATLLEIGVRTTLFSVPGTGFTPYVSSFLYGPYGGGGVFNPSVNRAFSGLDDRD